MKTAVAILAACAAMGLATAAEAREDGDGWTLSGDLGVVSDYQYRGYSLSGGDWAVQGSLTLTAPNGVYGTVWASQIEEYGVGPDGDGAQVELDASIGRSFSAGGWDWDVALYYYGYPDGTDVDYFEIPISASKTVGALTTSVGLEYAPEQDNLGGQDNSYVYLAGNYAPEHWPVSVNAQLGHEDGAFADGKLDWQLGLARDFGPFSFTLQYADSDGPGAESSVTGGLTWSF